MRNLQTICVRLAPEQVRIADETANRLGLSRNRLLATALAAYCTDTEQSERIEALVDARLREQTESLATALAAIDAAHTEQDKRLREAIRGALNKVLQTMRIPAVRAAVETANPQSETEDEQ